MEEEIQKLLTQPRIALHATPDAKKTRVTAVKGDILHLDVAAPPEDGKANREIERYLTRIAGKKATVTRGKTSKDKTVKFV